MRRLRVLTLCLGWAAAGCHPQHPAASDGTPTECSSRLAEPAPEVVAPSPISVPSSHISVDLSVSLQRIRRELQRRIPQTLAQARRQPIGAPGDVSYRVTRGDFSFALQGSRLSVNLPVSVEAEVCKPLGPFCPSYGRCSPRLSAAASLPVELSRDYSVGRAQVGVSVIRPCVIAGFDATPEIRRQAARQVPAIQRQIDSAIPDLRPGVQAGWQLLHVPMALSRTTCLRVKPERVVQKKPKLANETLTTSLSVSGELGVEEPCQEQTSNELSPLPPLTVSDEIAEGISLQVPLRIDWNDVSTELTKSLASDRRDPKITRIEARATQVAGKPRVLLRLTLGGSVCGALWAHARFSFVHDRLALVDVRPAPNAGPDASRLIRERLAPRLAERSQTALPISLDGAPSSLSQWVADLTGARPEGVEVNVILVSPPDVNRVEVESDHLTPIVSLTGRAEVLVK